jgi:hypothetical protein
MQAIDGRRSLIVRSGFGNVNNSFPEVCRHVSASIPRTFPGGDDI